VSGSAFFLALIPFFGVLLFGFVSRAEAPPRPTDLVGPIYGDHSVTQVMYPYLGKFGHGTLSGVDLQIATYGRQNQGTMTLRVHRGNPADPLRIATVPASELRDNRLQRFEFETIELPWGPGTGRLSPLRFTLTSSAPDEANAVAVAAHPGPGLLRPARPGEAEPLWGMTFDGVPLELQLAHSYVYPLRASDALATQLGYLNGLQPMAWPWLALFVLLMPGVLLARLALGSGQPGFVLFSLAPGFAVALIAILTLWTGIVGVRPGPLLPIGVSLCAAVGYLWLRTRESRTGSKSTPPARMGGAGFLALGAVTIGLAFRAFALDGLATPPGADSYHHALITQLILDRGGGVPSDYAPYAPITSYAYHFGLHATAAWIGAAVRWDGIQAVSSVGLLLNGLIALSVFALAILARLGTAAAVAAAAIVGLASPFPMWFLDVGRYPQEAALLILPVAAAFWLRLGGADVPNQPTLREGIASGPDASIVATSPDTSNDPTFREGIGPVLAGGLLAAGLFLAHYRIALMLLALVGVHLLWILVRSRYSEDVADLRQAVGRTVAMLVVAGVLVAPWIARLLQGFTLGIRGSEGRYAAEYYNLERLGTTLSHPALVPLAVATVLGFVLAIVMRAPLLGLLGAWGATLIALSNPHWVRLPGAGALDSTTVISSLYVIGALAVGYLVQQLWDPRDCLARLPFGRSRARANGSFAELSLGPDLPAAGYRNEYFAFWLPFVRTREGLGTAARSSLVAGLGLLAGLAAMQLPGLVRPVQSLAAEADVQAAHWIAESLPVDARFLVNASIVHWEPDFVEPTDAGAWLPLLARRQTTLLPLVYAGERGASAADIERMERIANAARYEPTAPATLRLLRESGVTHVYLGVRGGPIDEHLLLESPAFRRIYSRDSVSIFELTGGDPTGDRP
jgi:hypothetical protein